MDVKGLTWVENVCQKFEAVCLEVEEIMYQDTLKFVENQMETVGASFKRFYSDVIEDLNPPSLDDSKKQGDSDSPALKFTDTSRCRKLKTGIGHVPSRLAVEKESNNFEMVSGVHENLGHTSDLHRCHKVNNLFAKSSGDFPKGTSLDSLSRQISDDCLYLNSSPGLEGKIQKDSQDDISGAMPPIIKNSNLSSSLSKCNKGIYEASDICINATSVSASSNVAGCDSYKEKSVDTRKALHISAESSSSDGNATVILSVEKQTDSRSPHDNLPEISAAGGKRATNTLASFVYLVEDDDKLSRVSSGEAFEYSPVAGGQDDQHLDGEASYMTITDQLMEAIQRDAEVNFEECVMVDDEELPFVPYKNGKQKVDKKGIRKVISSRKNSIRKREYEQLAMRHAKGRVQMDSAREIPTVSGKEVKAPLSHQACESEWELL